MHTQYTPACIYIPPSVYMYGVHVYISRGIRTCVDVHNPSLRHPLGCQGMLESRGAMAGGSGSLTSWQSDLVAGRSMTS